MATKLSLVVLAVCILSYCVAYEQTDIISAKIETCRGCSLNRLPEVKKFVMDDAPFYNNLEVKFISGAPPELIFLGEGDQELERLPLSNLNRQECNDLLLAKGFKKINKNKEL